MMADFHRRARQPLMKFERLADILNNGQRGLSMRVEREPQSQRFARVELAGQRPVKTGDARGIVFQNCAYTSIERGMAARRADRGFTRFEQVFSQLAFAFRRRVACYAFAQFLAPETTQK